MGSCGQTTRGQHTPAPSYVISLHCSQQKLPHRSQPGHHGQDAERLPGKDCRLLSPRVIPSILQTSQTTCFTSSTTQTSTSASNSSGGSGWFSFSSSSSTSTSTTGGLLTSFTSSNTSGGSMRDYNVWMPQSM